MVRPNRRAVTGVTRRNGSSFFAVREVLADTPARLARPLALQKTRVAQVFWRERRRRADAPRGYSVPHGTELPACLGRPEVGSRWDSTKDSGCLASAAATPPALLTRLLEVPPVADFLQRALFVQLLLEATQGPVNVLSTSGPDFRHNLDHASFLYVGDPPYAGLEGINPRSVPVQQARYAAAWAVKVLSFRGQAWPSAWPEPGAEFAAPARGSGPPCDSIPAACAAVRRPARTA